MNLLSREELRTLMAKPQGWCVSIYQPTHRPAAHTEQDRIRFKNLLRQAEERLVHTGLRSPAAREVLAPGQALLDDSLFWQHQGDGLAVFLAQGTARHYCLPLPFEEVVVVAERFHVKPLVPLLSGDGRFYVLALSQNEVRLLQGTRHSVSEVDLQDVPRSLAEALRYDDPEKQLQWHTRAPERGAKRATMFHGHGVGVDDAKDRILRYFREIDAGLRDFLRDERAPLVLAGVDYYFPIYREANSYPHLVGEGVAGNPEALRAETLHRQAWAIVEPIFQTAHQDALARYRQLAGTGRTSAAVEEILPAAHQGRVDSLLVGKGTQRWGTFDPNHGVVWQHERPEPGDKELLDLAVVFTLSTGGAIFTEDQDNMPDGKPLAAVLRH